MGRRQNPLIAEFFLRGPKVEDSSNRYQQTCRRCGLLFEKGRIEGLLNHIVRRCPNATQQDRETAFQQTNKSSVPRFRPLAEFDDSFQFINEHGVNNEIENQPSIALDLFQQLQESTALDTLAEVSRRHLDFSSERRPDQETVRNDEGHTLAEQNMIARLQEAGVGISNPPCEGLYSFASDPPNTLQERSFPFDNPTVLHQRPRASEIDPHNNDLENEPSNSGAHTTPVDPHLGDTEAQVTEQMGTPTNPPHDSDLNHDVTNDEMVWDSTTINGAQNFVSFDTDNSHESASFGLLHTPGKAKGRNKFNEARRKEVGKMRKQGACLRCKMLKKPCSEGSPCNACRTINSARIWKSACVRSKLSQEFTLWSTNLFHSKAVIEVSAGTLGLDRTDLPTGCIEIRFFRQSTLAVSFACSEYQNSSKRPGIPENQNQTSLYLLEEKDLLPDKLELYLQQVASICIEEEASSYLRSTLLQAQKLMHGEEVFPVDESGTSESRKCYKLQAQLVHRVVELWIMTRILAAPHDFYPELRYTYTTTSQTEPDCGDTSVKIIETGDANYELIKSQLLAFIESCCSISSKIIINEIERSLLQRQQASKFATFISAVLLLNCVERLTGAFKAFDNDIEETTDSSTTADAGLQSDSGWGSTQYPYSSSSTLKWNLTEPPQKYWSQGESFSNLLIMLLRLRGLPPEMIETGDGVLMTLQDYNFQVNVMSKYTKNDEQYTKMVANWLNPLNLRLHEWMTIRDQEVPNAKAGVRAWDLRFLSRLMIPSDKPLLKFGTTE